MMKCASLVAIVSMTIVLSSSFNSISAQEIVETLEKLVESAKSLESASAKLAGRHDRPTLFAFVRASTGQTCSRYLDEVAKVSDQFEIKAKNFAEDSKKPKGWFSGIARAMGPLNGLRQLSRSHKYLSDATEALVAQVDVEALSDEDVTCEVAKFQTVALNKALFVVQTEIKYLVTEEPALVNTAIMRQLQQDQLTAPHNFYEVSKPTRMQRELLKQFLLDRVNKAKVSVGEAVDHFSEPSSLILGRLLYTCQKFLDFSNLMEPLPAKREESCSKSKLARKRGNLKELHLIDEDMASFCKSFLAAL